MLINVIIEARDSTVTDADNIATGLTPAWTKFSTYAISGTTPTYTDQMPGGVASGVVPAITPIQSGALGYAIWYDPEANGEAIGQLDMGPGLADANDRYKLVQFAKDSADVAAILAAVLGTGTVVKANDTGATSSSFTVSGAPPDAQAGDYIGATAIILTGTGAGSSAPITASTAAPVRLTLGSGLQSPPDDGAIVWILT